MPYKRRIARKPRLAKKTTKKYSRGSTSVAKLKRQVSKIARNFKPEQKEYATSNASSTVTIGQVEANLQGYYAYDVTPTPNQGPGMGNRIGTTINLKRVQASIQLIAQSAVTQPISIKFMWVAVKGIPQLPGNIVVDMFKANPFIMNSGVNAGVIDYNSLRHSEVSSNYKVVRTKIVHLPIEQFQSATMVKNFSLNLFFRTPHKITFDGNTNNVASGSICLFAFASAGNKSTGSNSTLTGIPQQAFNTGVIINTNFIFHYYDQ